ncbi:MAG: hypothetical protein IH624_14220 [Phycisphaerae bacterium]|nr:hypothetical protein [Phycisphaerae bacterium]
MSGEVKLKAARFTLPTIVLLPVLLSVMTYSLCFACNVVVRKTARSWLIGMGAACLLLLVPFVLPLGYKDIVSDVALWASGFYLAIMLVAAAGAFVLAILAAQYDWRLKTNLKGLLWAGAAMVFGRMLFASSQVANLKVLAEFVASASYQWHGGELENVGGQIVLLHAGYVDVDDATLSLQLGVEADRIPFRPPFIAGKEDGYSEPGGDSLLFEPFAL